MNFQNVLDYYKKELSAFSLLYKKLWTTYFFLAGIPIFAFGMFWMFKHPNEVKLLSFVCLLYFFVLTLLLDSKAKKYVKKYFSVGSQTIATLSMAIRSEQKILLKNELQTLNYTDPEQIDDLIEYYESKNEKSKLERLLPFSILVLIFLPIWNEYVGFRFNGLLRDVTDHTVYNQALNLAGLLMLMGVFLWLFVFIVVKMVRFIFLNRNNKIENLCDILREISHELT